MLINRGGSWPQHSPWFFATFTATLAAVVWYVVASARSGALLGGGSLPGLTFGIAGGLIVVFEMLLWVRKKFRAVRVGRAKLWMKAHIWLGFLCLPLIILHSGFRLWNGSLACVLMFSFLGVIVSGVWGLALQQALPKFMLDHVPAETILSQVDVVLEHLLEESGRIVRETCGRDEPHTQSAGASGGERAERERSFLVIGAVRASGPVQGKLLLTRGQVARVPNSEPLLAFFEETVAPYLRAKRGRGSPLASEKAAGALFRSLRGRLDPAAHGAVDTLEDVCSQRRQFDLQARIHAWLHAWLCVHLPLSAAMFIMMIAHIYYAIKYY